MRVFKSYSNGLESVCFLRKNDETDLRVIETTAYMGEKHEGKRDIGATMRSI